MRIFCAIRHSIDPRFYYGGLWSGNFYPALRQLGHEIVESDVDLLPASRFMHIPNSFTAEEVAVRADITQRILDDICAAHKQKPIDLFLSYFYNSHFDPAGFDKLRELCIPSVNFFCNSIYQFQLVRDIARGADFSWHAEKDARALYLEVGANPVWVQMGADPHVYHPIEGVGRERVACFVGQRYADRDRWAAALTEANIPLVLYGPGWNVSSAIESHLAVDSREYLGRRHPPAGSGRAYIDTVARNWRNAGVIRGTFRTVKQMNYRRESRRLSSLLAKHARGSVSFEKQKEVFARSEVVLNFSNVWADGRPGSKLVPHVRLRDFEAPMCRSCYLTGRTDEIEEFYEIGKEIEVYRNEIQLIDKVRFYLSHPIAAEKLREAGYKRAIHDHTWKRRFEELFAKIELY